jgi:aminopeptidase N
MRWDEERFGLEYDLDTYMIVAVGSFNMGAMENKGLNIFNSQYILADPSTATDANYLNIDRVVAHEYFHNWTGNRVTCRDWFQLTLKEGLTVFRDQEFSSDVHSRLVKRIEDVNKLRTFQFPEDSGPNSHPIRPESYMEINNFYTLTIYEKGAEVIRMIHSLLGEERFQLGMKRYFELYDGMAVTCDDFVKAMEDGAGRDLTQFMRWYEQAGTPVVEVRSQHDAESGKMRIDLRQESSGAPLHIPFRIGIITADGGDLLADGDEPSIVLELRKERETFEFDNIPKGAVLSVNRGFSAPVRVLYERTMEELLFLFSRDSDPFNRWDAGQEAAIQVLREMIRELSEKGVMNVPRNYLEAWASVLSIPDMPLYFKSQLLRLPSEQVIAQEYEIIDFDAIHDARTELKRVIGATCRARLMETYRALDTGGGYLTDMRSIGMRDLRLLCLDYLASTGETRDLELCKQHFAGAANMTDEAGALAILADIEDPVADAAIAGFYERWKSNTLVMMKWFSVQALSSRTSTLDTVIRLERDQAFDIRVPNLVRSLTGAFAQNAVRFNDPSGRGYGYVADRIIELDTFNPSMSSMLAKSFKLYNRVDPQRRELMKKVLEKVLNVRSLSKNAYEIVSKTLNRG